MRCISWLNNAASVLAVYASSSALLHSHVRLASGWWLAFTGRDSNPLNSAKRFQSNLSHFLLFQIYPGATTCSIHASSSRVVIPTMCTTRSARLITNSR